MRADFCVLNSEIVSANLMHAWNEFSKEGPFCRRLIVAPFVPITLGLVELTLRLLCIIENLAFAVINTLGVLFCNEKCTTLDVLDQLEYVVLFSGVFIAKVIALPIYLIRLLFKIIFNIPLKCYDKFLKEDINAALCNPKSNFIQIFHLKH